MRATISSITMTQHDVPMLLLAEPAVRQVSQSRVSRIDAAFVITTMLVVAGGAAIVLDLGAARSSGGESMGMHAASSAAHVVPGLLASVSKYLLLLLASVVNSAVMVAMVYGLGRLDRAVRDLSQRSGFAFTGIRKTGNIRRPRGHRRVATVKAQPQPQSQMQVQAFLLSPLLR